MNYLAIIPIYGAVILFHGGGAFKLAYANGNDWDVQLLLFKPYW